MTEVVTRDYSLTMQAVNIKELKARLSSYIRQVRSGETFLVTDRSHVVAKLEPVAEIEAGQPTDRVAKLAALGVRLPLRARRPTDYARTGLPNGVATATIDSLLEWARGGNAGGADA